ncbi:Hypothetical predicted protein [Octopus vulgaris]|uniref:Band 7 domain-containing protein n=1 Tax=Octopus vulgaris TaxID=6645 RepID=A0AA36EWD2_OCTVU|nr:Hypothetical predicted protein [Octopus vulgaris]
MGFEVCGPNEVMVISGCFHSQPSYIRGGRAFVWPGIQKIQRLSLATMSLAIESQHVYTKQGVAISMTGIAQIKVQGSNDEMLHTACELFLGKNENEIEKVAKETLEGHQRAIMGNMTVEEIYKDRKKFSKAVFEVASSDLVNMGIYVVSYTLKDIRDDEGYLKALGLKRTAEVKRDARIGEAEAKRDAGIREAKAEEQKMAARYANDIEISKAQRDFELKKAAYDQEVNSKKAMSDMAYDLQAAKTKQKIKEEDMQVVVVERTQQIAVQEQEIVRRERELDSQVRKPAEAEKYRLEKIAEANRNRIILEAEANAAAKKMKGEAEAYAIQVKAKADAEQMKHKAIAWQSYEDAAKTDMILEALPKIAAEIAAPLAQCRKVTMVSTGKSEIGAAKLTNEVLQIMEKLPHVIEGLTGVNLISQVITNEHPSKKFTLQ